jgi:hypothetical protein
VRAAERRGDMVRRVAVTVMESIPLASSVLGAEHVRRSRPRAGRAVSPLKDTGTAHDVSAIG